MIHAKRFHKQGNSWAILLSRSELAMLGVTAEGALGAFRLTCWVRPGRRDALLGSGWRFPDDEPPPPGWRRALRHFGSDAAVVRATGAHRAGGGRLGNGSCVRLPRRVLREMGVDPLRDRVRLEFVGPILRLERVAPEPAATPDQPDWAALLDAPARRPRR